MQSEGGSVVGLGEGEVKPGFTQFSWLNLWSHYFDRILNDAGMVGPDIGCSFSSVEVGAAFCLCGVFGYC